MKKHFRIVWNNNNIFTIQRRICFVWIYLYDVDKTLYQCKSPQEAERLISSWKGPNETYVIEYIKKV